MEAPQHPHERETGRPQCHPNCGHTQEEHEAFDLGVADARKGKSVFARFWKKRSEAYLSGHSAGLCDIRDSAVVKAWMKHSGISQQPPYTGEWQERFEQFVAGWDAKEADADGAVFRLRGMIHELHNSADPMKCCGCMDCKIFRQHSK